MLEDRSLFYLFALGVIIIINMTIDYLFTLIRGGNLLKMEVCLQVFIINYMSSIHSQTDSGVVA